MGNARCASVPSRSERHIFSGVSAYLPLGERRRPVQNYLFTIADFLVGFVLGASAGVAGFGLAIGFPFGTLGMVSLLQHWSCGVSALCVLALNLDFFEQSPLAIRPVP